MKKLIVNKKYNNMNISKVICKEFPNLSKNSLYRLFRLKDIKVNGNRIKEDCIIHSDDEIEIYADDSILLGIPKSIEYYYEDANILVAYKPRGIFSNYESEKNTKIPSFEELVIKDKNNNEIKICHRLDTNTEGLVIFSKNDVAHKEIINAFKNNLIHKSYITFVKGKMPKIHDILSGYIVKDIKTAYSKVIDKKVNDALDIKTEYTVLKYLSDKDISILNISLHTGRTHQIRAHMKYLNHPVIGDSKYGDNETNRKFKIKHQLLFAYKYVFDFSETSDLHYLNNKVISLDESKIINIL